MPRISSPRAKNSLDIESVNSIVQLSKKRLRRMFLARNDWPPFEHCNRTLFSHALAAIARFVLCSSRSTDQEHTELSHRSLPFVARVLQPNPDLPQLEKASHSRAVVFFTFLRTGAHAYLLCVASLSCVAAGLTVVPASGTTFFYSTFLLIRAVYVRAHSPTGFI